MFSVGELMGIGKDVFSCYLSYGLFGLFGSSSILGQPVEQAGCYGFEG